MMKSGSVKSNFIYNSLYQILILILPLVTTPYISRTLGAEGIGEYAYHFSIAKYFVIFAMMGLNNYGNRTIAAVRDDKEKLSRTFSSIYAMQLLASLIAIIVYLGYIIIFKQGTMAYVLAFYVVSAGFDINWFFFGIEQFKLTVLRNAIIKLLSVSCIFIFVRRPTDVFVYGFILSFSFILSQLAIWPFVRKFIHFVKPTRQEIIEHIKPNLTLFVPVIAVSLYKYMDKIMLGAMADMTEVGYYENTEKIIDIPVALVTSLGTVMLPKMSNLVANKQQQEGERYTYYSVLIAIFLASSLGFGIMAISNEFVPWFFGAGFDTCISLFAILSPSTIFMAIANVMRTQYLIPTHKDKIYLISVFMGAITNIFLNSLLIPKMQSAGAAIGTLAAEAVVCLYQYLKIRKETDFKTPIIRAIPFVISGIVMWIVIRQLPLLFSRMIINIIIEAILGFVVYCVCLGIILYIRVKVFKCDLIFPEGIKNLFKKG